MTTVNSWRKAFSIYTQPRVFGMIFLGFSAGLPFLLVFSTLSAWLRDEGVEISVIGFFSWVGVTYSIKVFWAPIVDRVPLPLLTKVLGKRRSWMLVAQVGIACGLVGMGMSDSNLQLQQMALFAVWVAFCSSTQDIVIDAYRIEAVVSEFQGAMAATYVLGYRVALLVAGAGAFYIADYFNWQVAYYVMAATMSIGVVATLVIKEPEHIISPSILQGEKDLERAIGLTESSSFIKKMATNLRRGSNKFEGCQKIPSLQGMLSLTRLILSRLKLVAKKIAAWFSEAVVSPFVEFFTRTGKAGLLILALIAVYKMSDITMGVMANPFYLDLGFSKKEIADVSKVFGFFMTIFGASLGGVMVVRYGVMRPLLLGAIMVATTNLLFALLAISEPNLMLLAGVISADNLSGGLATSVFIAYLSSLTNSAYTATQYALFSSLMTLPAKLLGGFSGVIVDSYGYDAFFVYASVVGLPAIILVTVLIRFQKRMQSEESSFL